MSLGSILIGIRALRNVRAQDRFLTSSPLKPLQSHSVSHFLAEIKPLDISLTLVHHPKDFNSGENLSLNFRWGKDRFGVKTRIVRAPPNLHLIHNGLLRIGRSCLLHAVKDLVTVMLRNQLKQGEGCVLFKESLPVQHFW